MVTGGSGLYEHGHPRARRPVGGGEGRGVGLPVEQDGDLRDRKATELFLNALDLHM